MDKPFLNLNSYKEKYYGNSSWVGALAIGLAAFVCFIMVLIKLFQEKGVLHGILGIICSLYTFIWGWMNVDRLGIRNLMIIWSAAIVLSLILNFASAAFSQ